MLIIFLQVHNKDGVWLRLSQDSIQQWCQPANGYTEAWALQYNQHLGKTLLVAVEEPKSILDEIIKDTILRRLPDLVRNDKTTHRTGELSAGMQCLPGNVKSSFLDKV